MGIALGLGIRQQGLGAFGGAGHPVQAVLQPLADIRQGGKIGLLHGAQPGKQGTVPQGTVGEGALRLCQPQLSGHGRGQLRGNIHTGKELLPQEGSRGIIGFGGVGVVGGALPGQGKRRNTGAGAGKCPQVFDAENVIGGGKQGGILPDEGMNGGLPCGGKGQPGRQPGGQLRREGGAFQGGGNPLQGSQVAALAAEYKGIHAAQGGKALHGACGKVLGGGNSIGQRQLQDEVNAAMQGGCDPVLPRAKGGLTALHKVAADDGDGMGGAPVAGGLEG